MKTEFSTNGEAPVEARQHRRVPAVENHDEKSSEPRHQNGYSEKEKKRSLFRRPSFIVVAAALAVV